MSVSRFFSTYKDEIELALIQNAIVECELYSIVANIIRDCEQGSLISLRDVTVRRTTEKSERLKGDGGFPDFVVLERKKTKYARKLGCIEVKRPFVPFDEGQLKKHIQSYYRVLITNGLLWRLYKPKSEEIDWEISLGSVDCKRKQIEWTDDMSSWYRLLQELDSIEWNNLQKQ